MLTFGGVSTYQDDAGADLGVSDDKRAFTLTFSDLQVSLDAGKGAAPIASRVFSFIMPIEGDEKNAEIEFNASAFVITEGGGTATIVLGVNGQSTVADFPTSTSQSVAPKLTFSGATPSECRLSVFLLAGQDPRISEAAVGVTVQSIDAEILPRPSSAAGRTDPQP